MSYVAVPSARTAKKKFAIKSIDQPRTPGGEALDNAAFTLWKHYKTPNKDPRVVTINVKRNSRAAFPLARSAVLPRLVPQRSLPLLPPIASHDIGAGAGSSSSSSSSSSSGSGARAHLQD